MTKLIIQMDEPETFNPLKDSTMALALEAQARGMEVFYYTPSQIAAVDGEILATVRAIEFFAKAENFFQRGEPTVMNLEEADTILIRQNPPYNMEYLGCTWLLERLQHPKVWNNPAAIRNRPEKIFPLEFQAYTPATCISADVEQLRTFHRKHGKLVMKPLYGFGGAEISLLEAGDTLPAPTDEPMILQEFLPQVQIEENRIMLINGKIEGAFNRRPPEGDFRTNGGIGGSAHVAQLTARQIEIGEVVGKRCKAEGLLFVGLDVIGDYLIEINTTCPTGIPIVKQLYDIDIAKIFWEAAQTC